MRARLTPLLLAACAAAVFAFAQPAARDQLLYNHSPSVPTGLYVRSTAPPERGAFVTVRALAVAPERARARGFDDPDDRFLKRIAAATGDQICADARGVRVNGAFVAARQAHDSAGRPLAAWQGCRALGDGEVLLLGDTPDSYDGRYWGPITRSAIEGVWRPLS